MSAGFSLTDEQQSIYEFAVHQLVRLDRGILKIEAGAGCGKTAILRLIADGAGAAGFRRSISPTTAQCAPKLNEPSTDQQKSIRYMASHLGLPERRSGVDQSATYTRSKSSA